MTDLETRALRDPRLRRHHAVVVLLCVLPSLPGAVKVRQTARYLDIERRDMRKALRLLVECGYLQCVAPSTTGAPATYALGAATGSTTPPVQRSAA